ncbi:MAG: dihydrodipicolinate synthase family protein [Planctomycetales bacterium]|nr:dihydrodipicolinate synthase family protein [Planctomycetales bacterium]
MKNIEAVPAWKTRRKILGMSAILLPLAENAEIDWEGFRGHVQRTLDAGLVPAVNMDTGYANLIDEATRVAVLRETQQLCGERQFVAGAFVGDQPGASFQADAYLAQLDSIQSFGGTPVIFQSFGLTALSDTELLDAYRRLAAATERFIGFELGQMFAPFGKIYSLQVYRELVRIPQCMGAKHSSLDRRLEWQRLAIRDELRPDFHVFTGNDLAIDMVIYGSDYLLGLSTMAPDLFALRDKLWAEGKIEFFQLNDWLQYLGFFAFRHPVPAYKHTAAQFLKLRGWIASDRTHPGSASRPDSDCEILATLMADCQYFRDR